MKEKLLKRLKELDIVYREPVKLKHGEISEFYVDIKKAYGYSDVLNLSTDCLWEIIDKKTTCIAAMGYGGISPASTIASKYGLNLSLIRETEKQLGKED
jgi:orotate phosphoribosyltransferase